MKPSYSELISPVFAIPEPPATPPHPELQLIAEVVTDAVELIQGRATTVKHEPRMKSRGFP